jgi:hypothetical protein
MNPKNHPSAYGYQPHAATDLHQPKPRVHEDTLHAGRLEIERKHFDLTLKENPRGRFLRITEISGSHRQFVIIPATGLKDLQKLLAEIVAASDALPQKKIPDEHIAKKLA